jgi:hypothetical protein
MVNLKNLNYTDIIIRFRQLKPMQQAAIVGVIFFVINTLYYIFLMKLGPVESSSMAIYSSIIFMVVYYFTSVIVMKKSVQAANQSKGPKKGLRNK